MNVNVTTNVTALVHSSTILVADIAKCLILDLSVSVTYGDQFSFSINSLM